MPDLWCTSQEFVDLGAGDYEEHSILLCNYFNYIDKVQNRPTIKSYIVLGKGLPEGYTCYVMRRDVARNHVELWNAIKGEAYFFGQSEMNDNAGCCNISKGFQNNIKVSDASCQLQSIGCVIGSDNIWANI